MRPTSLCYVAGPWCGQFHFTCFATGCFDVTHCDSYCCDYVVIPNFQCHFLLSGLLVALIIYLERAFTYVLQNIPNQCQPATLHYGKLKLLMCSASNVKWPLAILGRCTYITAWCVTYVHMSVHDCNLWLLSSSSYVYTYMYVCNWGEWKPLYIYMYICTSPNEVWRL